MDTNGNAKHFANSKIYLLGKDRNQNAYRKQFRCYHRNLLYILLMNALLFGFITK